MLPIVDFSSNISAESLTIEEVDTLNGTVIEHDTLTVSADGKTITIEAQRTGDKAKQAYVYDKQGGSPC